MDLPPVRHCNRTIQLFDRRTSLSSKEVSRLTALSQISSSPSPTSLSAHSASQLSYSAPKVGEVVQNDPISS
jgi:hypothetical protein